MKETPYIRKIMIKLRDIAGDSLYWHKVADAGSLEFSQPRAVDVLASYHGKFIGMEFKLHKVKGAFALKRFRQSQYDELDRIDKSGGRALIVIGVYVDNGKHQEIYIIPFVEWHKLLEGFAGRPERIGVPIIGKSIKLNHDVFNDFRIKLSKMIDHQMATTILNRIVGTE